MSADRREKVVSLLATLPGTQTDSLRILAHALLNLTEDSGADVLRHLSERLPWIAAQLNLDDGRDREVVAAQLQPQLNCGFFPASLLSELMVAHGDNLTAICELEQRLSQLQSSDPQMIRDRAFQSSRELALFGQIHHFPEVPKVSARGIRALRTLADLESRWERALIEKTRLSERSKRFEISAVDHLAQSGFLASVRAALAFGDDHTIALDQFTVFQDDHTLAILARALGAARGRVLEHLKGKTTLESLAGWVEFLRGASADIAEARQITHKEALSFVHFSFHLMNLCDLFEELGEETDDTVRRSMMAIEDGLKEFAAMRVVPVEGSTTGSLVRGLGLRKSGDVSQIADRLARLSGHWTRATEACGLGGLGQLDVDICKPWLEVLVNRPMHERTRMADLLTKADFEGDVWCLLSPESSVNLLMLLSSHTREQTTTGFIRICLEELAGDFKSCEVLASELNRRMAQGDLSSFEVHSDTQHVMVRLVVDPEVRAISQLLKSTSSEALHVALTARIRELIGPVYPMQLRPLAR